MAVIEGATHPPWASRIAAMEAEIAAIRQARARGEQAHPPLFEGALEPAD
jgi:hypothetical protein